MQQMLEQESQQRFSLYLQPEGAQLEELTEVVKSLAQSFGGPVFVPHVTLIPERWGTLSEIIDLTQEIATYIKQSLPIILSKVGVGETYFKCVYFDVVETAELLVLAQKARENFGVTFEEVPFRAHFSMVYDGFDSTTTVLSAEQKQAAAEQLRQAVQLPLTYEASGIAIHTSTPLVSEWQQVGFVPFG